MKQNLTEVQATIIFADNGFIDGEVINARDAAIRMVNSNFLPVLTLGTHDWVYLNFYENRLAVLHNSDHSIEVQEMISDELNDVSSEAMTTYLVVVGGMLTIVLFLLAIVA